MMLLTFLDTIENLGISTWVREAPTVWAYPTVLLLHVIGMGIVAGGCAIISLRLLGVSPTIPLKPMEKLFPFIWWGFWINAITGTGLLMASATKRMVDPTFWVKMVFIFAGVYVLQLTRKRVFATLGPDEVVPDNARVLAWASLICWLGAITAGRLLAYI